MLPFFYHDVYLRLTRHRDLWYRERHLISTTITFTGARKQRYSFGDIEKASSRYTRSMVELKRDVVAFNLGFPSYSEGLSPNFISKIKQI